MIIGFIINAFLTTLDSLVSMLPALSVTSMTDSGAFDTVQVVSGIFPLQAFTEALLMYVAVVTGIAIWDLSVWIFHQLHGSD